MHGAEFIGEMFSDLTKGSIFISSLANDRSQAKRIPRRERDRKPLATREGQNTNADES